MTEKNTQLQVANEMDTQVVEKKIKGMMTMVQQTKVTNDTELEEVAEKISNVKKMGKVVRAEMEKYTKPAQDIIRNAQAIYLPYEKECKEAETILKHKADQYMTQVEEERRRKEESIAARAEKGQLKEQTALRKMEEIGEERKTISTGTAKLTRKMVKKAYIVDPSKVPAEYWIIDEARVKKVAIAGAVIPGVEVREESQMSS